MANFTASRSRSQQTALYLTSMRHRYRPLRSALSRAAAAQFLDAGIREQLHRADDFLSRRRHAEAIPHLTSVLRAIGCRWMPDLQGLLWMLLGAAYVSTGNFQQASVCYQYHLACCIVLGDFAGITWAEGNLGLVYTKMGLLKIAERWFIQYLENSYRLEDWTSVSEALSNLGVLSKALGQQVYEKKKNGRSEQWARRVLERHLQRAVTYLKQHLAMELELGNLEKQARAYGNLGNCFQAMQQYPKALFHHSKRLEILRMTGDRIAESCTLCNMGDCLRAAGQLQDAIDLYAQNLDLSRAAGYRHGEIVSLLNLGTTCELIGQPDRAIEWHTLYLSVMVEKGDIRGQARALSRLAGNYEETHQMTKAEYYYRKLVAVFGEMGEKEAQRMAHRLVKSMKSGVKREKRSSVKQSRKTLKKYRSSPRRGRHRTVSCSTLHLVPEPKRRSAVSGRETESFEWREQRLLTQPSLYSASALDVRECGCVILGNNPGTPGDRPFLQEQLVAENTSPQLLLHRLACREHEDVFVGGQRKQDCVIPNERPLPQTPPVSDTETQSLTSFETVTEYHLQHYSHGCQMSQQHSPLLPVSQPRMDKEWEQWQHIQDTTDSNPCSQALSETNIDTCALYGGRGNHHMKSTTLCSLHSSAPNVLGNDRTFVV